MHIENGSERTQIYFKLLPLKVVNLFNDKAAKPIILKDRPRKCSNKIQSFKEILVKLKIYGIELPYIMSSVLVK